MNLVFLTYNNYYNRIIKKLDTIAEYEEAVPGTNQQEFYDIQFNPNDGIDTEQIVNWGNNEWIPDYLVVYDDTQSANINIKSRWFVMEWVRTRTGQYKATLHRDVIADNYTDIINAPCFIKKAMLAEDNPFILNSEGMSYNQIKKEEILLKDGSATPWIVGYLNKKGDVSTYTFNISSSSGSKTLTGVSNIIYSVIQHAKDTSGNMYNLEVSMKGTNDTYGWTFNTITKVFTWNTPWTLMDDTNTIEIQFKNDYDVNAEFEYLTEPSGYINAEDLPWDFSPYDTYLGGLDTSQTYPLNVDFDGWNVTDSNGAYGRRIYSNASYKLSGNVYKSNFDSVTCTLGTVENNNYVNNWPIYTNNNTDMTYNTASYRQAVYNATQFTKNNIDKIIESLGIKPVTGDPTSYNNTIIKYQGNFYNLAVASAVSADTSISFDSSTDAQNGLYSAYQTQCQNLVDYYNNHNYTTQLNYHVATATPYGYMHGSIKTKSYALTITRLPNTVFRAMALQFPAGCVETQDAPYNIFCMPLNKVHLHNSNVDTNPDATLQMALQLPAQLGSNLYDLQLLPYCPIQSVIMANGDINELGTEGVEFSYLYDKDPDGYKKYNICFFCRNSKGTFDIDTLLDIENYTDKPAINVKIDSETKMYRLVSPNYNGQFEFKVANNRDSITKINVDYEYKPYSPYIHLSPVWNANGLYGGDYDDARGLICGGDFSLPIVNDAWTQYQIQNKNYQNIFDRQIQNMQVNFNLTQSIKDNQAIVNAITAPIAGAGAGASKGGGVGAVAGAGIGALTAGGILAGRVVDAKYETQLYSEQESYVKDSFKYQLQNIQALPYSISKVSAFNNNNKLYPFIEKYEATAQEINALINKINYTSMELGIVDVISNYLYNNNKYFISGELIRMDSLVDDTHTAAVIYDEIKKGVYM